MYITSGKCKYHEEYEPEHVYVFTGPCIFTGKPYTVRVPGESMFRLNQGQFVQDACPHMSPGDREFITQGISPEGWDEAFGPLQTEEEERENASTG